MKNHRPLLAIACLVISAVFGACQPKPPVPTILPQPRAVQTVIPTPNAEQVKTNIAAALTAVTAQANRMDITTDTGSGSPEKNSVEFVPPDRKHITSSAVEYIVVEGKVYSKTESSGKWEETQIPAAAFMGDQNTTSAIGDTISEASLKRKDTLNGTPVIVYGYKSTSTTNGVDLHNQVELWVGEADRLPYKMVMDGETLSVSIDPKSGESKPAAVKAISTTLFTFDPSIKIDAPLH